LKLKALHTPGHTPEHLSFMVSEGFGADGDCERRLVFVGDLGRPDLLETAAGQAGTKEVGARQMFESVQKFIKLPEYVQVWPGMGLGARAGRRWGPCRRARLGMRRGSTQPSAPPRTVGGFV